jgi:hypothetical protein
MIKTLLIVLLVVALALVTALTRPTPDDFQAYLKSNAGDSSGVVGHVLGGIEADEYAKSCEFHNRLFWEDVYQNGARVYVGVAEHWVKVH